MEWLKRMNDSIRYLEEHLEDEFDIDEVAKISYSSKFHFQRNFHMITGVTVGEYVRKRRLTLAAQELASSDVKVIDIAFKFGYSTPESFSKAFRKFHDISPIEARELGIKLKAYPRLSFQISVKGDKDMNYKIVEKESFNIIGKELRVSSANGESFKRIPKFWDECHQDGTCNSLGSMASDMGILGVCMDFSSDCDEFSYVIAIEKPEDYNLKDYVEKEIPGATWAIFESIGPMPGAIQEVIKRIHSEWFPATGYEHSGGPELEVYLPGNPNDEDYKCEVWMPIIKK